MRTDDYKFSVLMSIYKNEKPEYFQECLDSLLNQTVLADEWVIVEDGPLTTELYMVIDEYKKKYSQLIKIVKLENNVGLGKALARGVKECSYNWIARMDTDDFAHPKRFEIQIDYLKRNTDVDIVGGQIKEFEGKVHNVISERIVPTSHDGILHYQKKRCPFNHMTVFYRKQAVLDSGNYQDFLYMEDDVLWAKMIVNGVKMHNCSEYLVYARSGKEMFGRRGGKKYFHCYKKARKYIYDIKCIKYIDYIIGCFVQVIVCFLPNSIRQYFFLSLLRKKSKKGAFE